MRKKQLLIALGAATLALPMLAVSCGEKETKQRTEVNLAQSTIFTEVEGYIQREIELNVEDITVYDAIGDITTESLKITNLKKFKKEGIKVAIAETFIDYNKSEVLVKVLYKVLKQKTWSSFISIIPFDDFKRPDASDWNRIFLGLTKYTKIELHGKNADGSHKIIVSNEYGTISNVQNGAPKGTLPIPSQISYTLTIKNSNKVLSDGGDVANKESSHPISGGTIINKEDIIITLMNGEENLGTINSEEGVIGIPNSQPTKEGYVFVGWSTEEESTEPNVFLNGEVKHTFNSNTSLYAVFKKLPTLILNINSLSGQESKKVSLTLTESGLLTKEELIKWVEDNKPEPTNKWSFMFEDIQFAEKGQAKSRFNFNEQGELTNKFEIGKEYDIYPNYTHLPVFVFRNSETQSVLGYIWADEEVIEEEKIFKAPTASLNLSNLEAKGSYAKRFFYLDLTEEIPYKPGEIISNISSKNEVNVFVELQNTNSINLDKSNLIENKVSNTVLYLTPDGKLREEYLPKDINYSWYNGISKRLFKPEEAENNKAFDNRSNEEIQKGVSFAGWYSDPEFKNKITFKNGISTTSLKGKGIYARFTQNKWDRIRDARQIMDSILEVASVSVSVAGEIVDNGNKKYTEYSEQILKLFKWFSYLVLGGKVQSKEFFDGFDLIWYFVKNATNGQAPDILKTLNLSNGEEFKGSSQKFIEYMLELASEFIKTIVGMVSKYSKLSFKNSVFTDAADLEKWDFSKFLNAESYSAEKRVKFLEILALNKLVPENEIKNNNNKNTRLKDFIDCIIKVKNIKNEKKDEEEKKSKKRSKSAKKTSSKSKSDVLIEDVFEIKENKAKNKKEHPYLTNLNNFIEELIGKKGIQTIIFELYELAVDSFSSSAANITTRTLGITTKIANKIKNMYKAYKYLKGTEKETK
ncbi:InlB B-repeat-containing protein [Mycoplasma phocimorsus]|uniref:InlB B-repeat-containing protein n=1 Tax=Mycoplasma phocimorsus TaxID=3045839 RepID=UPI0024BF80B1|nr:InlB B-repeat-containing protein [Mycoplasma phocimorsus]MDJ1649019.1 InlB B-repeat-containing protein [Mycoplasma phocimorsus]